MGGELNPSVKELREAHASRMARDEVLSIDYHRNGVGGDGFFVALVRVAEPDQKVLVCIVPAWAVFGNDGDGTPLTWQQAVELCPGGCLPCYCVDPELASGSWTKPGTVQFDVNSWRGDHYFEIVAKAARERS